MRKVLFVNGCPRPASRTLELARTVLEQIGGEVQELRLFDDGPEALNWERLSLRDRLVDSGERSHPMLRFAEQFAGAEEIVIAAPYWDLMFPAVLRSYLEAVTVNGIAFVYGEDGRPRGLCRAKRLTYVTTSGGPIIRNFAFEYVDALARSFYGIPDTVCITAEGLDIRGADVKTIMDKAKERVMEDRSATE